PIYFKNTMRERLREVSEFQRSLEAQLDAEEGFLESLSTDDGMVLRHRKSSGRYDNHNEIPDHPTVVPSSSRRSARRAWEDERTAPRTKSEAKMALEKTIQEDLSRLNEKLDRIQHLLHEDQESYASSEVDLEAEEPVRVIHDEMEEPSLPPEIERLDFRALTPPVEVGRRRPAKQPKATAPTSKSERTLERIPPWVKPVPLKAPVKAPSKPTLPPSEIAPVEIMTAPARAERGCQVEAMLDVATLN
ncbi:hypothetical protein PFISCL1PPCAC_15956, partial [Pristionchus fissidentatus]